MTRFACPATPVVTAPVSSMAVSISFKAAKRTDITLFFGQWAAPFLILGIYNKPVKIHCSDGTAGA